MPKIATYDAPINRISPSERGGDAATRAGRYVGQYRRQEAEDIKAGGVLQAQGIRERGWPFDILALEEGRSSGGGSGGGRGGGGSGGGGFNASGGSKDPFGFNDHGQTSRGAAALGGIAQRFNGTSSTGGHGKVASREQVNPDGSRYKWFNDGSREVDRADGTVIKADRNGHISGGGGGGGGGGGRQALPYTLEGGRFVPAGQDPMNTYNKRAGDAAQQTAEYWSRYNGGAPIDARGVDDYGIPRSADSGEYGNPNPGTPDDGVSGYRPPPDIPGPFGGGDYGGGGESGSSRDPIVNEVSNWIGAGSSEEE